MQITPSVALRDKTTWYLQSHFEWKGSNKGPTLLSSLFDGLPLSHLGGGRLLSSTVKRLRVSLVEPAACLKASYLLVGFAFQTLDRAARKTTTACNQLGSHRWTSLTTMAAFYITPVQTVRHPSEQLVRKSHHQGNRPVRGETVLHGVLSPSRRPPAIQRNPLH